MKYVRCPYEATQVVEIVGVDYPCCDPCAEFFGVGGVPAATGDAAMLAIPSPRPPSVTPRPLCSPSEGHQGTGFDRASMDAHGKGVGTRMKTLIALEEVSPELLKRDHRPSPGQPVELEKTERGTAAVWRAQVLGYLPASSIITDPVEWFGTIVSVGEVVSIEIERRRVDECGCCFNAGGYRVRTCASHAVDLPTGTGEPFERPTPYENDPRREQDETLRWTS